MEGHTGKRSRKSQPERLSPDAFIRLKPVLDIIQCAIWTGKLKDEKPLSIALVAEQESAKSQCLLHFNGTSTLQFMSDLTSKGLDYFKNRIEDNTLRHLVILDLVRVISHGRTVSDRTIQVLASIMEEGQAACADGGGLQDWKNFPTLGVLLAVTPKFFRSKQGRWRSTGFMTRFIPVHYHYNEKTVQLVHRSVRTGTRLPDPVIQKLPKEPQLIKLSPKLAQMIETEARRYGSLHKVYAFRYHKQLRSLVKARALMLNRKAVTLADLSAVLDWSRFFNMTEPVEV